MPIPNRPFQSDLVRRYFKSSSSSYICKQVCPTCLHHFSSFYIDAGSDHLYSFPGLAPQHHCPTEGSCLCGGQGVYDIRSDQGKVFCRIRCAVMDSTGKEVLILKNKRIYLSGIDAPGNEKLLNPIMYGGNHTAQKVRLKIEYER